MKILSHVTIWFLINSYDFIYMRLKSWLNAAIILPMQKQRLMKEEEKLEMENVSTSILMEHIILRLTKPIYGSQES